MSGTADTLTPPVVETKQPLTAQDRCDANCSAQAYVRVTLAEGVLLFCGHHYRRHEPALAQRPGVKVEDFTGDIPEGRPGASAAFGH